MWLGVVVSVWIPHDVVLARRCWPSFVYISIYLLMSFVDQNCLTYIATLNVTSRVPGLVAQPALDLGRLG